MKGMNLNIKKISNFILYCQYKNMCVCVCTYFFEAVPGFPFAHMVGVFPLGEPQRQLLLSARYEGIFSMVIKSEIEMDESGWGVQYDVNS